MHVEPSNINRRTLPEPEDCKPEGGHVMRAHLIAPLKDSSTCIIFARSIPEREVVGSTPAGGASIKTLDGVCRGAV